MKIYKAEGRAFGKSYPRYEFSVFVFEPEDRLCPKSLPAEFDDDPVIIPSASGGRYALIHNGQKFTFTGDYAQMIHDMFVADSVEEILSAIEHSEPVSDADYIVVLR